MEEESHQWKQEYLKDDFVVDTFLSKYIQRPNLETLRTELKEYANELHKSMSEILKMETEAIVNLAENLTNLNSKIIDLSSPIFQLHEEIRSLFDVIKSAEKSFEFYLENVGSINNERDSINMKKKMSSNAVNVNAMINYIKENKEDSTFLERAVNEYSFIYTYIKEKKLIAMKGAVGSSNIGNKLKTVIDEKFIDALKPQNEEIIIVCLRMYVNLMLQRQAEDIYKNKIIFPALEKIITRRNLEKHEHNLRTVFQEALNFLNFDMKILHEVLRKNSDLKGFNFIINSYWNVVDKLLRENLPDITAPGNPELFQQRFQDTWNFLQSIINKANDPKLIYEKSFQDHFKRFNLAVYFEIRFQQISANFETELQRNASIEKIKKAAKDSQFKLKVTSVFWKCIDMCFHPEVYLDHLSDHFIKCSMLLLSRYLNWLENLVTPASNGVEVEMFLVNALIDLNVLKNCIGLLIKDIIGQSVYRIVCRKMWPVITKIVVINEQSLNNTYKKLQLYLINLKVQQSESFLKEVTSIPRLYRRTNKTIPKDPSKYVQEAVVPILSFYTTNERFLADMPNMMDFCITKIGKQYLSLVQDVLLSVCKTEESLRRLKSRNLNVNEDSIAGSTELTSDESKIREQIRLDIEYFIKQLFPLASTGGKNVLGALADESGFIMQHDAS